MAEQPKKALCILRRRQLEARIGLSRATIYGRLNPKSPSYDPAFPKPIVLGTGMTNPPVGWIEAEVDDYLAAQVEKRHLAK